MIGTKSPVDQSKMNSKCSLSEMPCTKRPETLMKSSHTSSAAQAAAADLLDEAAQCRHNDKRTSHVQSGHNHLRQRRSLWRQGSNPVPPCHWLPEPKKLENDPGMCKRVK